MTSDELELGWLLAVAGAAIWSPRALSSWFHALGDARAIAAHARTSGPFAPEGAEPLSDDVRAKLAALDDAAAAGALRAARACGARVITQSDGAYPKRLRDLCDAPLALYCRGDPHAMAGRCVALVGSRAATRYGRAVAGRFARDAGAYGAAVVSGLARGVDAAAHRGSIESGGITVAVIGSGLASLYPPYHSLLADEIAAAGGAVISEFPPAMAAKAHQFPMRNRIVAALAEATVVVEAASRSGALITARLADELGRPVFAVPGDVDRSTSAGANALIRDGVTLSSSMADVAEALGWTPSCAPSGGGIADGSPSGDPILAQLRCGESDVDELATKLGRSAASVAAGLTILELQGLVERLPGGSFAAVRPHLPSNAGRE